MRIREASGSKTTGRTRTVVLNELFLNRELESILELQVDICDNHSYIYICLVRISLLV